MATRRRGMCWAGERLGMGDGRVGSTRRGGRYGCRVCTQGGQLARQAIDDGFLFLLELEVHLGGRHGTWMPHGHARRLDARCVAAHAWAQRGKAVVAMLR